jgi:hypothetical protein
MTAKRLYSNKTPVLRQQIIVLVITCWVITSSAIDLLESTQYMTKINWLLAVLVQRVLDNLECGNGTFQIAMVCEFVKPF